MIALLLLSGCGLMGPSDDDIRAAVQTAFDAAHPDGRTGLELAGKGVWLDGPMFDAACLKHGNVAHPDHEGLRPDGREDIPRVAPSFEHQNLFTASTAKGYCVYIGDDPFVNVDRIDNALTGGLTVDLTYHVDNPTEWGKCLSADATQRRIELQVEGGQPVVGDLTWFEGTCPSPLPGGEERSETSRPKDEPPKGPTDDEVRALARAFDDALWAGDHNAALARVSCWNLLGQPGYGNCSVGEIVAVGPVPRGELRPQDGTSWLENTLTDLDALGRASRDRQDKTMFHVPYRSERGKSTRSISVQWVDGGWRLVAVVGLEGEGLTSARFVNDLHDREQRDIFERRVAGEKIDHKGQPILTEEELLEAG